MPHELIFGSYRANASALADELRLRLRAGERCEVIVPTRSAAGTLLSRLEDVLPTTRLEVHSIETLATRIVNEAGRYPRLASEHERELAMELAARSTDAALAATPGMTSMLLRSERDVRDSGIALSDLRLRVAGAARLTVRDRLQTIERIWTASAQTLRESGATTASELLTDSIALLRSGTRVSSQVVFGFYDATGLQRSFLDALAEAGLVSAVYVPAPIQASGELPAAFSFARPFVDWARTNTSSARTLDDGAPLPDWTIAAYASPLAELHEVCRAVRTLLDDGVDATDVAIVARSVDPTESSLLSTMARRFGFSLHGLSGRRLSGNRIARGLVDLLLLQERNFLRRDVMEIIRSGARLPDIDGPLPSLDRLESATRRARISRGRRDTVLAVEKRVRYSEEEPDETLLRYAEIVHTLDRLTSGFSGNRTGATWSHGLETIVAMFRAETDEDLDALEALRDLSRALRRPGFAMRRFDARSVARLIEDAGPLPSPTAEEPAIWFGDLMRFRGLAVRHVFAVRMQSDTMPQRRIEDALLPDVDRRALGVRQIGDGRDEEALLFSLLTAAAAESIHFSFASSDSIGRTLRPSPLVKDFVIARRPDEKLRILQDMSGWLASAPPPPSRATSLREAASERRLAEADPPLVRALQLASVKGTDSPFDGRVTPDERLRARLEEVLRRISPSRLEHLGECPQRFFVTSILGIKEVEDPEPNVQIEIREKGQIDHKILEELYSTLSDDDWRAIESGDAARLPTSLRDRLTTVVETRFRAFDEDFPPLNETIRAIERDETTEVLHRFAAADLAELAATGFRPVSFELLLDVDGNDESRIRLGPVDAGIHGFIDRVDRHDTGGIRVIDYKAGKAFRLAGLEERIDDGLRLQLALYALVVRRLRDLEPDAVSAAVRPLRVDSSEAGKYEFQLAERFEHLTAMLDLLGDTIFDGRFPAVPFGDVCNYCVIKAWCRTRNDPREAAHATRFGSAVRLLEAGES
jgi:RecB family exonuclease